MQRALLDRPERDGGAGRLVKNAEAFAVDKLFELARSKSLLLIIALRPALQDLQGRLPLAADVYGAVVIVLALGSLAILRSG